MAEADEERARARHMGKIIWLASYPKSGNTWLRAFLHNFLRNPEAARFAWACLC